MSSKTMQMPWRGLAALCAATMLSLSANAIAAQIPTPTVTGPIASPDIPGEPTHNYSFFASNHPLAANGYTENEYFYSGMANRYTTPSGATGSVIAGGPYAYTTRMVVRAPADARKFNGTVLVEWYNVTNDFDAENFWFFDWEHILAEGYAWVGISAQRIGVADLQTWNPTRYASLNVTAGGTITDDSLSYDIFSQAGAAIRHPGSVNVLNGLKVKQILAVGESQSANRLSTYVNSVNPLGNVYDGFVLLSTLGVKFRTDLTQPVFKLSTEYDVSQVEATARQPNTEKFVEWEIAGSSHVDQHLRDSREPLELRDNPLNTGTSSEAQLAPTCVNPTLGTLPPTSAVVNSAVDKMVTWLQFGEAPPAAPYIQIAQLNTPPTYSVLQRTSLGLAVGGVQLPEVAVPTALNVGVNAGPGACVRWGYHEYFSEDELDAVYPSYNNYVNKVVKAANTAVGAGWIEQPDAAQSIWNAIQSSVGNPTAKQKQSALQEYYASFGTD
jgi:hypothetical protein